MNVMTFQYFMKCILEAHDSEEFLIVIEFHVIPFIAIKMELANQWKSIQINDRIFCALPAKVQLN